MAARLPQAIAPYIPTSSLIENLYWKRKLLGIHEFILVLFGTEEMGQKTKSLYLFAPTLHKDENCVQIPQCRSILPCLQRILSKC